MIMDYKTLAKQLVTKCLNSGADEAEVYIENARNLSIEVRNGEVETVEESSSRGVGFRVFKEGKMAFSHCNDFEDSSLDNAISRAVGFAGITTPDENNVLPDEMGFTEVEGLYDPGIINVSMDEKIELAKQVENLAMKVPLITKSAGSGYGEGEGEVFLANSRGLSKNYKMSACSFGVSVVAEKGEQKSSGGEYCSRRFYSDLKKPGEVASKAAEDAFSMLDPRMVKTQKAAVIFDPDVGRSIFGGILAAVNGERVLQGASFLMNSLDKKIASESLNIIDDGTRPKGMASCPFDGEGVPTQKRIIVENGVLRGFMYNTIVAKRAGVKSTGNASRRGFNGIPGIGPHNFYMDTGDVPPEDIIAATEKGLLLKGVTGYGINPVNGNFSGGASGFWIEKGKIMFPVKELTIAGKAAEMLNQIDMVGNDLDLNRSFAAPTFRIATMQIGGE
jgi:PmbA protein